MHEAANTDYLLYRTADKDRINKILQCKSDDERKAIKEQYRNKYGIELENEVVNTLNSPASIDLKLSCRTGRMALVHVCAETIGAAGFTSAP